MHDYYEKDRDIKPMDCWISENNNCIPHFHSAIELVYVISGELEVTTNGKTYHLTKGQGALSPQYALHTYKQILNGTSVNFLLPTGLVPYYTNAMKNQKFLSAVFDDEAGDILNQLQNIIKKLATEESSNIKLKGYAYVLIGSIIELLPFEPCPNQQTSAFNKDILIYLQDNFTNPNLSISKVSSEFGYSESRFSHLFTKTIGFTFHTYLGQLRAQHSATLLKNTELSLIDIALNSGFDTLRTFYRTFKKIHGMTPTQFIKSTN